MTNATTNTTEARWAEVRSGITRTQATCCECGAMKTLEECESIIRLHPAGARRDARAAAECADCRASVAARAEAFPFIVARREVGAR